MNRTYPEALLEEFGNDLNEIFGTAEEQVKKIDLRSIAGNTAVIEKLIKSLPNNGILDVYEEFGKYNRPTFLEVAVKVLKMFQDSGIFKTYKLPPLTEPHGRVGGASRRWEDIYLRYPVQRSVKVWHILEDILCEWDPDLNDPMYVRVLSDGTLNCNDKQHGNFGRLIMGYEDVIVEGITSDDESMDSNMYASRNIHNLESSWENNANVRVTRAVDFMTEGKPVKEEDQRYYRFWEILDNEDSGYQESGLIKRAGMCQNGEKLFKDYNQYGEELFTESVKICRQVWPNGELPREVVWGLCEFLKQMNDSSLTKPEIRDIKSYVKKVLATVYVDNPKKQNRATGKGTLWGSCLQFLNTLVQNGENRDWRVGLGRNYTIAAGIRDLILNWNAYEKHHSNRTPVKMDIPNITTAEGDKIEIRVNYFPQGWSETASSFHRDDIDMFNHTEIEFEVDEIEEDEIEAQ